MLDSDLLRSVTDAALELCCGEEPLKGRLLRAVRALNVTLSRRDDWPGMLCQRAQDISDALNTH